MTHGLPLVKNIAMIFNILIQTTWMENTFKNVTAATTEEFLTLIPDASTIGAQCLVHCVLPALRFSLFH